MVATMDPESLREASLKYLWMHSRDWVQMAEEGEPIIMVEGNGIEVTDSAGKTWIDANAGYASVNVGYERTEIADAAYDQMLKITFNPHLTSTAPVIKLAQKLADITPGNLSRVYPVSGGSEANETALKIARSYHKCRADTRSLAEKALSTAPLPASYGFVKTQEVPAATMNPHLPACCMPPTQSVPLRDGWADRLRVCGPLRPGRRGPDTVPRT